MKILITSFLPDYQNRIAAAFLKSFKSDLEIYISGNSCKFEISAPIIRVMEESFLLQNFLQISRIENTENTFFSRHIILTEIPSSSLGVNQNQIENKQTDVIILPKQFSDLKNSDINAYRRLRDYLKDEMFKLFKSL